MKVSLWGIELRTREDLWFLAHAIIIALCNLLVSIQSSVVLPARHRHPWPALIAAEESSV